MGLSGPDGKGREGEFGPRKVNLRSWKTVLSTPKTLVAVKVSLGLDGRNTISLLELKRKIKINNFVIEIV